VAHSAALDGKVVIEVRANEYTMRDANPHVPWSAAELAADAAACRTAGAAVWHFHARDPETGAASGEVARYAEAIVATRAACDLVLNPTLGATTIDDPTVRVAHIPVLAADPVTRPDLAPVDLGSFNIDPFDPATGTFSTEDLVYRTSVRGLRHEIDAIAGAGVGVQAVLWNVGCVRLLEAFCAIGQLPTPVLAQVVLSDSLLVTHPPTMAGLDALTCFLPRDGSVHWAASRIGGSLLELAPHIVESGGHLALGLGDHHYGELGTPTNAEVVAVAVEIIRSFGLEPATPDDVRAAFGLGCEP